MTRPYQPIKILQKNEAEKKFQEIDRRTGGRTPRPKEESIPRSLGIHIGNTIIAAIRNSDHNVRVSFAGSIRREVEEIHDIDILVSPYSQQVQRNAESWGEILWTGLEKVSILMQNPLTKRIQVDIRFIPPENWAPALQYFTGSREHNIRIRAIAKQKGLILSEKGVFDKAGRRIDNNTEGSVYTSIGLRWLPPKYRSETFDYREPKPTWCIEHQIKDFCKRSRSLLRKENDRKETGNTGTPELATPEIPPKGGTSLKNPGVISHGTLSKRVSSQTNGTILQDNQDHETYSG